METPTVPVKDSSFIHDYIAGAIGGMSGIVVGYPFDTTKVQLQIQQVSHGYKGTADALQHIHTNYGWSKGFLKGLSWPLISYGAVNSIFFGVYGSSLRYFQRLHGEDNSRSYFDIYMAGCIAGGAQLVIACPVDLIKVILQSQIQHNTNGQQGQTQCFKSPLQCAKHVVRTHGFRGLYKGNLSMMYRDIPSFGLYCLSYEYLTDLMHKHELTDSRGIIPALMAGGSAGVICWFSIMPFDVIKSRWQADINGHYKGLLDCTKRTVQEEGIKALYKGTVITCLRAFPVNAAVFLVYAQVLKYLNSMNY